jgi:hypothetical protein
MKKSELKQIIREEISKALKENLSFDIDPTRGFITINSPLGKIRSNIDQKSKYRNKHYSPDRIIVADDFVDGTDSYNKAIQILKDNNIPYKLRKARVDNMVRIMMDITDFLTQEEKDKFNKYKNYF